MGTASCPGGAARSRHPARAVAVVFCSFAAGVRILPRSRGRLAVLFFRVPPRAVASSRPARRTHLSPRRPVLAPSVIVSRAGIPVRPRPLAHPRRFPHSFVLRLPHSLLCCRARSALPGRRVVRSVRPVRLALVAGVSPARAVYIFRPGGRAAHRCPLPGGVLFLRVPRRAGYPPVPLLRDRLRRRASSPPGRLC